MGLEMGLDNALKTSLEAGFNPRFETSPEAASNRPPQIPIDADSMTPACNLRAGFLL
jgi:hypothetical protein